MDKILPYGKHFIDEDDINAVSEVLRYKNLTQGEEVSKFEEAITKYIGVKYAIAVSSWTSGLHLSCLAVGISKGDYVVTSPITFVATSNAIVYCNAKPVFCDIDPKTINICPNKLEDILKKYTVKAVIPVHYSGLSCKMEDIEFLSKKYNFKIIEDAAHALGGKHLNGLNIGSCKFSDISGFSLHPVKSIATGEGGIITTNNENYYKKLIRLRSHGINKNEDPFLNKNLAYTDDLLNIWYYEMQELGYNYRLTDFQSALGRSQLKKLDDFIEKRIKLALNYDKAFESFKNIKPIQKKYRSLSSNHLYVIKINFKKILLSRAELILKLREKGIYTQVHYIPVFFQPFYNNHFQKIDEFSNSIEFYNQCLSIPLYYTLTFEEQQYVINQIKKLVE